jgi:hypothetical protein
MDIIRMCSGERAAMISKWEIAGRRASPAIA